MTAPAIAISIHNVTHDFGSVRALNDLSLDVPRGSVFGFLGPNGAGKTTTIHVLLGLLDPASGTASVLGFDTRRESHKIRSSTGALLEHTGLYEQLTAAENLQFYGRVWLLSEADRSARVEELLTRFDLWKRRDDRVSTWSRGMKQKLALARTLLAKPQLLLLDEPTAGLDVLAATEIRENLVAAAAEYGATVFLSTHNMTEAERICERVAIIREGQLLAMGTPDSLKHAADARDLEEAFVTLQRSGSAQRAPTG